MATAAAGNLTDGERWEYLSRLEQEMFPYMVPTVVYLACLFVLGIAGNILVLIVYLKKFKPSPTRVFVVSLAIFDLMTCVISLPGEILDLRLTHTFRFIHLCRILRFNNTFSVVSSGFTLIAVSIDRYRKICRPLQKQITIRVSRIMVGVAVSVSLLLSIPNVIVNGRSSVITDIEGITGVDCSFDDQWRDTMFPLVYTGVLFLFFFGSLCVLIIMYILIGKTVFSHRRFKFQPDTKSQSPQISTSETDLSSSDGREKSGKKQLIGQGKTGGPGRRMAWISPRKTIQPTLVSTAKSGTTEPAADNSPQKSDKNDNSKKPKSVVFTRRPESNGIKLTSFGKLDEANKSKAPRPEEKGGGGASKTTRMLFVITAVFIISFLPHLILMITRGFNPDFVNSLSNGGKVVYNIFLRSYFINCAANCIVYSFCNIKFRKECTRQLCPCVARWK